MQWAGAVAERAIAERVRDADPELRIVLTMREPPPVSGTIAAVAAERHVERRVHACRLCGLDDLGVAELLRGAMGVEAPPAVVACLRRRTAGTPLYLRDLLGEHGAALARNAAEARPSPALVRLLWTRAARAGGPVLHAAAAAGTTFNVASAARAAGVSAHAALAVLEAALATGDIEAIDGRAGWYRFRAGLVREALGGVAIAPNARSAAHSP